MSPKRQHTLRPTLAEMERVIVEAELHLINCLERLKQCQTIGTEIAVARYMVQAAEARLESLHQLRDEMLTQPPSSPRAALARSARRAGGTSGHSSPGQPTDSFLAPATL